MVRPLLIPARKFLVPPLTADESLSAVRREVQNSLQARQTVTAKTTNSADFATFW